MALDDPARQLPCIQLARIPNTTGWPTGAADTGEVLVSTSDTSWGDGGPATAPAGQDGTGVVSLVPPPTGWLVAAAGTATVSLILWLPGRLVLHGLGYILSTFITLGLLAGFKRLDLRARQSAFYSPRPQLSALAAGVTVVAIAGALLHVWVLATYWAG
jgi:hypothetical protein